MKITDLQIEQLHEAPWNANRMDDAMLSKLRTSITKYGLVENIVVRPMNKDRYEVLSGNHRLQVLKELGYSSIPCMVVELDDAHARLLSQTLNNVRGQDDLGLRAEVLKTVLDKVSGPDILSLLPETAASLKALTSINQETLAGYLQNWQKAQAARLHRLQFQLTQAQLEVVEEALARLMPQAKRHQCGNPNLRSTALYLLCKNYLGSGGINENGSIET